MQDALSTRTLGTVWLDVTASWRGRGGAMNGTLRVEQSCARALAEIMPDTLRLCRYNAARVRYTPFATLPAAGTREVALGKDKEVGTHSGNQPGLGRRVEKAVRKLRQSTATEIFRWVDRFTGGPAPFPEGRPGDVLLLLAGTLGRYDLSVLRVIRERVPMRIAAVCNDMMPIKCPQFFEADGYQEDFERFAEFLVKDVDLVICISEKTKSDLLEFARARGGMRGDIQTIKLGHEVGVAAPANKPATLADLEPNKFALSVSTIQSRKNFDLLYHLWKRLSEEGLSNLPKLVIAGRRGFGSRDLLWQIAHDPAVRDFVVVRYDISDAALAWLYRECAFTLYPSFYEGWGLPVSESLAHGKFCIASTAPALVEAGQGLTKHIDPLDFVAWKSAIVELVRSPETLADLERPIKTQYRRVTWLQSAQQMAALIKPLRYAQSPPRG